MEKKSLIIGGIALTVLQVAISSGLFVTYQQMVTYAAPKDEITSIKGHLIRIEEKLDRLIMEKH